MGNKKALLIGGGISNCSLARMLLDAGWDVKIREKSNRFGGMLADKWDKRTQCYISWSGPHVMHFEGETRKALSFLKKHTALSPFKHRVLCLGNSSFVYFPINKTYKELFEFMHPQKSIFDEFISSYSKKMWGQDYKNKIKVIKKRFKFRNSRNEDFFEGREQFQPLRGYTNMMKDLAKGAKIKYNCSENISSVKKELDKYDLIVVSSHVDTFFNYKFEKLEFRGLDFKFKRIKTNGDPILPTPVVNLPTHKKYIRISEANLLQAKENNNKNRMLWVDLPSNKNRFYPVETPENLNKLKKYENYALNFQKIRFLGRTANYKYKDIDDCIMDAFKLFKEIKNKK